MKIKISLLFILVFGWTAFGQSLPAPELVYDGKEEIKTSFGEQTVYRLGISNRSAYPDEMFETSPDLPPCGRNKNSSRSWVDIFTKSGSRIYGFCVLKSAEELNTLAFRLPKGKTLKGVYIVITDRKSGVKYKSNIVALD